MSATSLAEALPVMPSGDHRLRITITPAGEIDVTTTPIDAGPPAGVHLRPVVLVGGLGAHKWVDRTPLDEHPDALILDLDGTVLEAATANVWAIEGETLVTPPADGRILPGIVRDRLLERGTTFREEPLDLARLRAADGIIVTSSIRIAAPAALGDDAPTERARAVAATLHPDSYARARGPVAQLVRAADS